MKPTQLAVTNQALSLRDSPGSRAGPGQAPLHPPAVGCLLVKESPFVSPSPTERDRPLQLPRACGAPEQAAHPGEEVHEEMVSWGERMPTCSPTTYSGPSSRTHTCSSLSLITLGLVLLDHGHLTVSSETCKTWADAVLVAPRVVVDKAGEMKE